MKSSASTVKAGKSSPEKPHPGVRIDTVAARYMRGPRFQRLAASSQKKYFAELMLLHKIGGGALAVGELTRERVIAVGMKGRGHGAALSFLSAVTPFFSWCVQEGYLTDAPIKAGTVDRPKVGTWKAWPVDMVKKLLASCGGDGSYVGRAALLALYTGQRIGDILKMNTDDLLFCSGTGEPEAIRVKQQKTGVELVIPVSPELQDILKVATANRDILHQSVYLVNASPKKLDYPNFHQHFQHARNKAGVPPEYKFHGLRKTCAVVLAESGATLHEIMAVGGWKRPATVMGYTNAAEQRHLASSALAKVGNILA